MNIIKRWLLTRNANKVIKKLSQQTAETYEKIEQWFLMRDAERKLGG